MSFSIEHLRSLGRDFAMGTHGPLGSSKEFLDLVKAIGEAKSKAEEDRIMVGEIEQLKKRICEPDISKKKMKEYLIRLVYVEMLGHDASFGYIHAVKMTHDDNLHLKKTGYLAVTLFLDDNHDLIILIVNTIQKDLKSDNHLVVCAALGAVCKLINEETIPAVLPQVVDLLTHTKESVRKKAVMALHRFYQRSPSSVSHLLPKLRQVLCDKDPSVMSASLCALHEVIATDVAPYKNLTTSFVSILKQVAEGRLPAAYNFHKTPAPFVQIKLLKILALLGAGDKATSEQMYAVLADVLKKGDSRVNIGNAILYECICTISSIYPNSKLLVTCAEITSRFLKSGAHNLKYMGIDALGRIVKIDPDFANEHQIAVIDCLEDPDDTLKRRTLDLLYKMTKPANVEVIVERMIGYMRAQKDAHRKAELSSKIVELAEKYAPTNQWFIQTMSSVFELAGDVVKPKVAHDLMRLIAEGGGDDDSAADSLLRSSAVDSFLRLLKEPNLPAILLQVICWVLGEYGTADGRFSADDIIANICEIADSHAADDTVKGYALSGIAKILSFQLANGRKSQLIPEAQAFVEGSLASHSTDLQQRAYHISALSSLPSPVLSSVMPFDGSCEDIEVDKNLTFVSSFVEDALMKGAKPYLSENDRLKERGLGSTSDGLLQDLHRPSVAAEKGLRFEAYAAPQAPLGPMPLSALSSMDSESSSRQLARIEIGVAERLDTPDRLRPGGGGRDSPMTSDQSKLRLDGVQRKWGRQMATAGASDSSSFATSAPTSSGSTNGSGGVLALTQDGGIHNRRPPPQKLQVPEVSEEKKKLAASLFGGKQASNLGESTKGGGTFSNEQQASSSRRHGSFRPSEGASTSAAVGGSGPGSQNAEPSQQKVELPDLLLDLGSVAGVPDTVADTLAVVSAPASDPFMELESLFVSVNSAASAVGSEVGASANGLLDEGDTSLLGLKNGDIMNVVSSLDEKLVGSLPAKPTALQKDAIARQAGVVTQSGGANAELFKDILG